MGLAENALLSPKRLLLCEVAVVDVAVEEGVDPQASDDPHRSEAAGLEVDLASANRSVVLVCPVSPHRLLDVCSFEAELPQKSSCLTGAAAVAVAVVEAPQSEPQATPPD